MARASGDEWQVCAGYEQMGIVLAWSKRWENRAHMSYAVSRTEAIRYVGTDTRRKGAERGGGRQKQGM